MKYIIIFLLIPFFLLSQDYSHIYNDVKKIPNKKYSNRNVGLTYFRGLEVAELQEEDMYMV